MKFNGKNVYTGAIFDESNVEAQIAFKHAVYRENIYGGKFNLVPITKVIDTKNTYLVEQAGKSIEIFKFSSPFFIEYKLKS